MIQRKSMSILLLFLLLPCKVETFLFPFEELVGLILDLCNWGPLAPPPEIFEIFPMTIMTTEETIQYCGYLYERHEVITDDGYILELHRIVNTNRRATYSLQREPMIFVPGLFAESGSFVTINQTHSPGFVFSDAGYDVWLHNNRGTRYSRNHTTLNPNTHKAFWNYSFHEMGVYDMPATVDYILKTTNKSQVYLTGISMGGTIVSIFLAEKPSYREKVKESFLWAPAIYLPRTLFHMAALGIAQISSMFLYIFDEMEVLPYGDNVTLLIGHICGHPVLSIVCQVIVFCLTLSLSFTFADYTKKGLLAYAVLRIFGGSSVKTLRHFIQMILHRDFSQYDYGPKGNMIAYNQTTAPPYVLQNIKQPTTIYYSEYDLLVNSRDILEISLNFTNLKSLIRVPEITFSHVDYVLSPTAKKYVFEPMLKAMSLPVVPLEQMNTSKPLLTTSTTTTPITTLTTSAQYASIPNMIPSTSTPIIDLDSTDYFYNVIPMAILIFVIMVFFMKFIQQQLSERKRAEREKTYEI